MGELNWPSLDNLQEEIVTAVLKMMLVTDELRRRRDEGASGHRAERADRPRP